MKPEVTYSNGTTFENSDQILLPFPSLVYHFLHFFGRLGEFLDLLPQGQLRDAGFVLLSADFLQLQPVLADILSLFPPIKFYLDVRKSMTILMLRK